jgi:hypothetical protein
VPTAIRRDVRDYVGDLADALIFTGGNGGVLRRSNFQRTCNWTVVAAKAGLPGFHFHDLRHTGNTLASRTGASLADLMARMGHSSTRAALIYQHTAQEQDREIADALSSRITQERDRARQQEESTVITERPGPALCLTWPLVSERVKGIEPSLSAWEADVLPLNYTREPHHCTRSRQLAARASGPSSPSRHTSYAAPRGPAVPARWCATIATSTVNS